MNDVVKSGATPEPSAIRDASNQNVEGAAGKLSILQKMKKNREVRAPKEMSVDAWLELCRTNKGAYADHADRMLDAIGEPEVVDTRLSTDERERRVFGNQKVLRYRPFSNFYDSEAVVSKLVGYIKNGAPGMVVLRGPVGSGKTEIATLAEHLMETKPIYVLKCKVTNKISPFNDSPTCLFSDNDVAPDVSAEYGIPARYLRTKMSSWVAKRLEKHNHDIDSAFSVVEIYPSVDSQIGVSKIDPQDPKSANLGLLIGEVDITMVGEDDPLDHDRVLASGDPDAYIPGAFAKSNQGMFHGAEFFRNNPALLNSFLEGVTTGYYTGDKGVGTLPMDQLIIITTNDPVWQDFISKNDSDAARNRILVIDVPYTLRMSEEIKIYKKLLAKSRHSDAPIAPKTLDVLAEFAVVSRMKDGIDGKLKPYDRHIRARVWNGDVVDGSQGKVPTRNELREAASPDEGMDGFSIREADTVMKNSFNARSNEGIYESDPILALESLDQFVKDADSQTLSNDKKKEYLSYISNIRARYEKDIRKVINQAMIDADDGVCQVQFDKYLFLAEKWLEQEDYVDPASGERTDYAKIDQILGKMEKKAGVTNPAEFRRTAVEGVNRELARIAKKNIGKPVEEQESVQVRWDSYEPLAKVIKAQHEIDQETRLHIFKAKAEADLKTDEEKRQWSRFNQNMKEYGMTPTMIARHLHRLELC